MNNSGLEACQLAAIHHVFQYAENSISARVADTDRNLCHDFYLEQEHNRIAALISGKFPIDVHFHPDRIALNGNSVIDGLLTSRTYENQFVSGVSNGLLDSSAGSRRKRWESRLFGGAYDAQPDALRPKYGAINLFNTWDGACSRFGSCYLRLKPHVYPRCTLSYGDSHTQPRHLGTPDSHNLLLNALYEDYFGHGHSEENAASLKSVSLSLKASQDIGQKEILGRILDDIVEVQLHGDLRIDRDVSFISVDSCFKDTDTGRQIIELAAIAKVNVQWRPELRLRLNTVPSDFRGKELLKFMQHFWENGYVNAYQLGQLANELSSGLHQQIVCAQRYDVLQLVKQTWHSIAAFGEPVEMEQ